MSSIVAIRRLHEHRQWATRHLLEVVDMLPPEQLHREFPIGQGTLWRALCHMYAAEYVWLAALEGDPDPLTPGDLPGMLPGNQQGEGGVGDLSELIFCWRQLDQEWNNYLVSLTDEMLSRSIAKRSTSSQAGQFTETLALDIVLHVCTHAHYTLAQAQNMLRQLGVEPLPPTMLITMARQQATG